MQQQASEPVALPEKTPTSSKTAKVITGCGGCGCLFGLLALVVGAGLLGWGLTDRAVQELVAPSAGILALAVFICFFGAALLIGGIVALRKAGKAQGAQGVVQPAPAGQQPYEPQQPVAPRPGGEPGELPSWDPSKPGGQGPGQQGY